MAAAIEKRLFGRIQEKDGCWEFRHSTGGDWCREVGTLRFRGKKELAHRVSYTISFGEIPEGMKVLHKCDNSLCVKPGHLFLGTLSDNMRDMVSKDRAPTAKFSMEQVRNLRELMASGEYNLHQLAERFSVARKTLRDIRDNKSYKEVAYG